MVDADPHLMNKCAEEIERLKCSRESSFENIVECLRVNFDTLSKIS